MKFNQELVERFKNKEIVLKDDLNKHIIKHLIKEIFPDIRYHASTGVNYYAIDKLNGLVLAVNGSQYKDDEIFSIEDFLIKPKFKVGDLAYKPKGYKFDSTIVSVFETTTGKTRIVAENGEGLLHIFNEDNLELR